VVVRSNEEEDPAEDKAHDHRNIPHRMRFRSSFRHFPNQEIRMFTSPAFWRSGEYPERAKSLHFPVQALHMLSISILDSAFLLLLSLPRFPSGALLQNHRWEVVAHSLLRQV
jgi:hypothetical protein